MKNFIKKLFFVSILSLGLLVIPTACKGEMTDYVAKTTISTQNWKESSYLTDGTGIVTLKQSVDGDTAHFYAGSTNRVIEGRFNGVDTPESTGIIEPWGKAAAKFTEETLLNAKTIILETERTDGQTGPQSDTTGRYLVWVWTSTRPIEEEDGSQLRLLNLELVQNGYSPSKGASGSVYQDVFLDADAQAQKFKLHIWSDEEDPNYYYGEAQITNMQAVFSDPSKYLGAKVYVEGVITRTMGTNAYMQESFEQEDGSVKVYGAYIFTMYKQYSILAKGNRVGVIGIVAEHYGSYQLVDVKYNELLPTKDDMKLLDSGITVDPIELTVPEALKGDHMGVLIKMSGLRAYGGYGGTQEEDQYGIPFENNSMTIYVEDSQGNRFNIRIDDSTFIRDLDGSTIRTYRYFEDYCNQGEGYYFDFVGLMGKYESQTTGRVEIQLMLVATSDLTYHSPTSN